MRKKFIFYLCGGVACFIGLFAQVFLDAKAQNPALVRNPQVTYAFGDQIRFQAVLDTSTPVLSVNLLFRTNGDSNTFVGNASVEENVNIIYDLDLSTYFIPAFSEVTYWFVLELQTEDLYESPKFSFIYDDNRFAWQTLESSPFVVHWYTGDVPFAQFVLDTAHSGFEKVTQVLGGNLPERLDIYIYSNNQDYQSVRGLLGPLWAGGHADPSAEVIVVSITPSLEQHLDAERKIPHEISHIILHQITGVQYESLPTWLIEGLATYAELYQSSDYRSFLKEAHAQDSLIPLSALCDTFPKESTSALLAYAESGAFVQFLIESYGIGAMQNLIDNYAQGVSCENGPDIPPFNQSLSDLYQDWRRQAFNENRWLLLAQSIIPWVVLAGMVFTGPLFIIIGGGMKKGKLGGK